MEIEPVHGKEYQLLLTPMQEPERVFSRDELLASI